SHRQAYAQTIEDLAHHIWDTHREREKIKWAIMVGSFKEPYSDPRPQFSSQSYHPTYSSYFSWDWARVRVL
ncbi:hypothetical protein HAX54_005764, partial [Datura stramonium]|nr:hypothetical protein [Datura stramonium]